MDQGLELLKELTEANGVSGYEQEVRTVIRRRLEGVAIIEQDRLGSIIARKTGTADSPRIMLAGHMDEIGFMVTKITKEGFLKFVPLGGWWDQVMLAHRVRVLGKQGVVPGVIGSKPPHILSEEQRKKVVEKKEMFIDIGAASDDEVHSMGVLPGTPVVPDSNFTLMKNPQMLMAKAWDDRLGCAMFIETIQRLAGLQHPNTVYGVGTVQEEVGLRGAITSTDVVKPDVGFALEVAIAGDTPGVSEDEALSKLGKGPAIIVYDGSMIPNQRLKDLVVETAEENQIPYQYDAMPGGGTDAGRIHIYSKGVPSLVIGVPTRYIHSHVGIINRNDYDNAVKLLVAVIQRLDEKAVKSLVE